MSRRRAQTLLWATALLVSPFLSAQDESEEDEIFELSPFTVEGDENQGYRATSTLAGTRIRTDLKDVGSAISVVTEEFLRDTGAVDNQSLLVYTTNTEVGGVGGNFAGRGNGPTVNDDFATSPSQNTRVRGLASADNTRNYFLSDIPWDGYNVSRVDMQRGPNAILFGLGSPAGIINTTTDSASFEDESEVELRFGSYGSTRLSFKSNKVVLEDELSVMVAGLMEDQKYRQKPAFEEDQRLFVAFRYDPKFLNGDSSSFKISGSYEDGTIDANRPRSITPMDRITQFWDPVLDSSGNYPLYGGTGGWVGTPLGAEDMSGLYGLGVNRSMVEDEDGNSVPNPNYIPMIGNFGQNFGGPLTVFPYSSTTELSGTTVHEIKTFTGLAPDGSIDGNISNPYQRLTSIDSYVTYARQANLPAWETGQYKNIYLQDASVFDFWNTLIDGPNKAEWEGFNALNLSVEQTFFNNKLGYELAFYDQTYDRGNVSMMNNGANIAIMIDTNTTLGDGSANPNLGRAFIADSAQGGNNLYAQDRDAMRFTVFAEYDFTDKNQDGWLNRLLGRHNFTGLYVEDNRESSNTSFQRYMTGPSNHDQLQQPGSSWSSNEVAVNTVHYLGGSLLGYSSATNLNIPGVTAVHTPVSGMYYSFDATWNADGVDPGALWIGPDGGESTQSENPANYVGWTYRPYEVLTALDGKTLVNYDLVTGSNIAREEVESEALVWQGYFWDGALVGTYGWREDTDSAWQLNAGTVLSDGESITDSATRVVDIRNPLYTYDAVPAAVESGQSQSWSAVVHLNKFLGDRLPLNVSFSYNESENFQPGAGRVDLFGQPIASPNGSTVDKSLYITTKDNRYALKITDYETTVYDSSSSYIDGTWFIGNMVSWGTNWANIADYNISDGYTLDGVWDPSNTDNSWRYNYDDPDVEAAAIAAWRQFTAAIPEKFTTAWGFNGDLNTDVISFYQSQPAGLAYTQDAISRGTEFELVANPTDNWRISLNASKTEAIRNNVGGAALIEWVEFVDSWIQDTAAGDIRIWWKGGPTVRDEWNGTFRSNFALTELQEGTATPELREWRYNLVTSYDFKDGKLAGTNVGMSYRWEDNVVIGYPLVEVDGGYSFDLSSPYRGPSEDHVDFWIGKSLRLNDKIDWRIQLNVRDAFAKKELVPISTQPNGDVAAVRIPGTTSWQLTNTFSF
ncbi:TonB-dependent receptor [Pelagicoccus albus]|uniref:TonB-dependent receptor n=1 Tax=Pelagicoccus albus TaxID=415222 RepID=A0A7X1B3Q2_9BACT|nr:TonB-dependent receptor [Pelagicoccus albus]MBC2604854.1 TonB-dependent receptor [Pelagicoccus albus]